MSLLKAGRPSISNKDKALAEIKNQSTDDLVKTSLNIPKKLHKDIKRKAIDQDITATDLIIKALSEYVKK